jgi:plastocyanin
MAIRRVRKPVILGLSLGTTLIISVLGCGGQATDSSDAVVVPDSTVSLTPASKTSASPAPGSSAPPSASAPSAGTTTATPVTAEGFGTLKGQVTFAGDPPTPKVLFEKGKAAKDPEVCAKDAPLVSERLVVDGGTKGVKNVFVYLNKPTKISDEAKKAAAATQVLFDQNGCVFDPHVLGILNGSTITLKSSDSVNHNINAKLKQLGFNQILAPKGTASFTPSGPERTPSVVTCDIHPWMMAWWMVFDHPYFAVTDSKGYFEIKNAPAGSQRVVVWQEALDKNGFVTAPTGEDVVIKVNDSMVKDFKIEASRLRAE